MNSLRSVVCVKLTAISVGESTGMELKEDHWWHRCDDISGHHRNTISQFEDAVVDPVSSEILTIRRAFGLVTLIALVLIQGLSANLAMLTSVGIASWTSSCTRMSFAGAIPFLRCRRLADWEWKQRSLRNVSAVIDAADLRDRRRRDPVFGPQFEHYAGVRWTCGYAFRAAGDPRRRSQGQLVRLYDANRPVHARWPEEDGIATRVPECPFGFECDDVPQGRRSRLQADCGKITLNPSVMR